MRHLRFDVLLVAILVATGTIAWLASSLTSRERPEPVELPEIGADLELPPFAAPPPTFVFRRSGPGRSPEVTRPPTADPIETALVEVRSALLASSAPRDTTYPE